MYALAKHCNFGDLHDEMMRDILVAGTHDKRLLEWLQLDGDLTPEKANAKIGSPELKSLGNTLKGCNVGHYLSVATIDGF